MKSSFTAIVKPTNDCNLECRYCYTGETTNPIRMDSSTLENTIHRLAEFAREENRRIHFIWHGGEPLLMGLDFFKEAAHIQRGLRQRKNIKITNSVQTNGTLLSEEFIDLFSQERFRVGFSLDGPKEIHNHTRPYKNGEGSFDRVFENLKRLKGRNAQRIKDGPERTLGGGAIAIISRPSLANLEGLYSFFRDNEIDVKFNPLVITGRAMHNPGLGLTPREYGSALVRLFDLWFKDPRYTINVDPFETIIGNMITGVPLGCNYSGYCRDSFISVGPKGEVYPCGRFDGATQFMMGNLNEGNLAPMFKHKEYRRLSKRDPKQIGGCKSCDYSPVCNSGCMHNAYLSGNVLGRDNFCTAYKMIFERIEDALHEELSKLKGGDKNE